MPPPTVRNVMKRTMTFFWIDSSAMFISVPRPHRHAVCEMGPAERHHAITRLQALEDLDFAAAEPALADHAPVHRVSGV
jgi:hypothetical protein